MAGDDDAHRKSNKPSNSNFRQQRLVAWQPIMSPPHVVACLMLVFVAFTPIGIALVFANKDALDVEIRYDNALGTVCPPNNANSPLFRFNVGGGGEYTQGCRRTVEFTVPELMKKPVYMYYKLTNFYQNHRRFAKSRSVTQLAGSDPTLSAMSDCEPLLKVGEITKMDGESLFVGGRQTTYGSMHYAPCGLVAWSLFNDSFALYRKNGTANGTLICNGANFDKATNAPLTGAQAPGDCTKQGITWESDEDKFKTPTFGQNIWTARRSYYQPGTNISTNNSFLYYGWYAGEAGHEVPVTTDQDLQVWMRTAALPDFRKLYRVINVDLPAGQYAMVIDEFYPVESFGGTKSFALSTISWLGGKNSFLAIAYLVVGGLSFVLGLIFLVVYKANGDRMQQAVESLSELQ